MSDTFDSYLVFVYLLSYRVCRILRPVSTDTGIQVHDHHPAFKLYYVSLVHWSPSMIYSSTMQTAIQKLFECVFLQLGIFFFSLSLIDMMSLMIESWLTVTYNPSMSLS
jgi:hypothetical protein